MIPTADSPTSPPPAVFPPYYDQPFPPSYHRTAQETPNPRHNRGCDGSAGAEKKSPMWGMKEPEYVYYRFYKPGGAVPSLRHVDDDDDDGDPYLGRIDALHVAPPHTAESIIRCICQVERVIGHDDARLFSSVSSSKPMDRNEPVAILSGSGPSADSRQPLALVLGEESIVHNKVMEATRDRGSDDPRWLDLSKNEVLYTDGIIRKEKLGSSAYNSYHAMTINGQVGFVDIRYVSKPCVPTACC